MITYHGQIAIKREKETTYHSQYYEKENAYEVIEALHKHVSKKLQDGFQIIHISAHEVNQTRPHSPTEMPIMAN